ncbi:hypothetical protein V6N12_003915 [Hibiscus sabdariffa]|uniref:Uncharacterized protein n=1 Tax=Hibiscus sabdariffa TaxID=183260 RepID=A0ABR2CM44_9ROSI
MAGPLNVESVNGCSAETTNGRCWTKVMDLAEAKVQILFAVPMVLCNVFLLLNHYGFRHVAGHLGDVELAGSTLANSWAIVTGFAFMTGLSGALETLCGQSFGAKIANPCFTSSRSWKISRMAALYMNLVNKTSLGFKGAAMAASISIWISFLSLATYVVFADKFKNTWKGWSFESFRYIIRNSKIALPSAAMVCLEFWAFEILVFLAGLMPNPEITTPLIAICANTENIAYMITYGLSAAASTRVSNELGAGNPDKAKQAMTVTLKLSVLLALVVVLTLVLGHNIWSGFFSDSHSIMKKFAQMTPLLAVSIAVDAIQGVLSGFMDWLNMWSIVSSLYPYVDYHL